MRVLPRFLLFTGMILLTLVSMWTTYKSLHDSILPEPQVPIPLGRIGVWNCSIVALALSVAIGVMLFGLKLAIIDEQKKLNALGIVGMVIVAFISIVFNMDVLYRTADREFFVRYSAARVKDTYAKYLAEVQHKILEKKKSLQTALAQQEGELETEILGLREAPAGYGPRAKQEDYRLTIMEKTAAVELAALDDALKSLEQADELIRNEVPSMIEEVEELQARLIVAVKAPGAVAGLPLPDAVRLDNPLFAVFSRLADVRTIGFKEIFFLLIALFLDLGDIIGYSLIPNKPRKKWGEGEVSLSPAASPLENSSKTYPSDEDLVGVGESSMDSRDSSVMEPQLRARRSIRKPVRFHWRSKV